MSKHRKRLTWSLSLTAMTLAAIFFFSMIEANAQKVKNYKVVVEESYPHDRNAYTQGLFFHDNTLFETTGQYGQSSIRKVDLKSGRVLSYASVERKYFLEGSCILGNKLYVLTWMENSCLVYDIPTSGANSKSSFNKVGEFRYASEGWGLTTDGKHLIMSDGTDKIYFRDPNTFMILKEIKITINGKKLQYINELEYIDGKIWANVYTTDSIVIIDPKSGDVEGLIDCRNLLPYSMRSPNTDVLNGIAWNPKDKSLYLTGKNWPKLFKVTLKEVNK